MSAPSVIHQTVVTNLSTEFGIYFKGKTCRHFVAPFDVVFKVEEKIHKVQPDLTVICDKSKLGDQSYNGVPELVVILRLIVSYGTFIETLHRINIAGVVMKCI